MVGVHMFANARIDTGETAAGLLPRGDLQRSMYMLAVGPPRSEITPVKPGTVSRMASILVDDRNLQNGSE